MTALIAVYNSEGCVGRCGARCYAEAEPDSDCICGGRNHGAGKEQALDNTCELAESWLERARASGQDIIFGLILAAFVAPLLAATRPPLRREPLGPKGRTFIGILLAALGAILFPVVTAWIVGTL